jgi:sphinganine-1-phosphate aldolase
MDPLSAAGVPAEQVLAELAGLRSGDLPTHGGRLFAYVYDPAVPGLDDLAVSAYALAAHVNGLDPTAFPSLLAMENGLVAAAARLLGGVDGVVGSVTSGGTESLILAVKAARDARPDLDRPRLVVPATAHAAFAKAASYLRVALDVVPVDPATLCPAPADLAARLRPETVLVACSAPSYAHGVVDPVSRIAAAAAERGVRCHVDACFGGWILPYLGRLGVDIAPFDFRVPDVTSISVDLHKYAYCPKGVSVLLHRDADLRRPQYFGYADWPGYTMVNATIASTRPGGPIAAAWATLRHLGDAGYLRLAERTLDACRGLADAVRAVPGLRLLPGGAPVVAFTADDPDLFVLADELAARGWHTQPQFRYGEIPPSIHLTVTASVAAGVGEFAAALPEAVRAARSYGPVVVPPDLVATVAASTPEALTGDLVAGLAARLGLGRAPAAGRASFSLSSSAGGARGSGGGVAGSAGGASGSAGGLPTSDAGAGSPDGPVAGPVLPARMAPVNALLAAAPAPLRERLLIEFLSLLQTP